MGGGRGGESTSQLIVVEFQEQKAQVASPVSRQGTAQLVAADVQVQQVGDGGNSCSMTRQSGGDLTNGGCQVLEGIAERQ